MSLRFMVPLVALGLLSPAARAPDLVIENVAVVSPERV
jgi:hypothetical protein